MTFIITMEIRHGRPVKQTTNYYVSSGLFFTTWSASRIKAKRFDKYVDARLQASRLQKHAKGVHVEQLKENV